MSWTFPPKCISQTSKQDDAPRLDCLFTSAEFRNGHGLSLVTTTTAASHLIGIDALSDRAPPLAARHRASLEPAYEVRTVQGKGKGVVATRRIRMGEIIMVDVPTVLIGISFLADTMPHHRRRLIKQAMKQLPEETQSRIYGLHRSSAKYEVDAILGPNSNTIMLADDEVHVGLFTEAAVCWLGPDIRNHESANVLFVRESITRAGQSKSRHSTSVYSSIPLIAKSAYYRFSERRLTMEVVAFHGIEPGEEIVMSCKSLHRHLSAANVPVLSLPDVPLETPRESRRNYLKENWGFDCTCSLCRGSETEISDSESWRDKIKSLKETILNAKSQGYYHDAIVMTEEVLQFSEWERIPPFMPEYHDTLADLYFLKGDMANATRYARMAVDGWARSGSVDDEELEKSRVFLRRLDQLNEKRR